MAVVADDAPRPLPGFAWIAAAVFFALIASYYVFKPIRDSLAIDLGAEIVPYLKLATMLTLLAANVLYGWLVGRFSRERFITWITRFFVFTLIGFWLVFRVTLRAPLPVGTDAGLALAPALTAAGPPLPAVARGASGVVPVPATIGLEGGGTASSASVSSSPAVPGGPGGDATAGGDSGRGFEVDGSAGHAAAGADGVEPASTRDATPSLALLPPQRTARPALWSFAGLMIVGFYVWVGIFNLFTVALFWSLVNDVCSVSDGRRHYALIGSGGLAGSLAGGVITAALVRWVGTANLLLVSAVLLELSVVGMRRIHRLDAERSPERAAAALRAPAESTDLTVALDRLRESPYLRAMVLEMFLSTLGSTLYDFVVAKLTEAAIPDRDDRTRFIAMCYNVMGGLSLGLQATVTRWLLARPRYLGLGVTLVPLAQGLSSLVLVVMPWLWVAVAGMTVRNSLGYGTGRAVREMFFTPLDRDAKYRAKGLIDTVVFRAGDGAGSLLLAGGNLLAAGGWFSPLWAVVPALLVSAGWFFCAHRLAARFRRLTRGRAAGRARPGSPGSEAGRRTRTRGSRSW